MYVSILEIAIIDWKNTSRPYSIMLRSLKMRSPNKLAKNWII